MAQNEGEQLAGPTEEHGPRLNDGPTRLTFNRISRDRKIVHLTDDEGGTFTVDLTAELRAAVRGDAPRRWETPMSTSIRPREIQTRIRAGETAETVAEAAGTTVDAIMPYVAPVLAEREHVAERAQKASLRRAPGDSTPLTSRVLGDAVEAHLRGDGGAPTPVTWDAYRRETGRWVLTGAFAAPARQGTARFTFDAPGNYVLADNDDARWLIGDVVVETPPARDDLQEVRERRLASVPADELPLGDVGFVEALDFEVGDASASPAAAAAEPVTPPAASLDEPIRATAEVQDAPADQTDQARHRRPVQKKRGRASVPSWDEIMFGGTDQG